MQCCTCKGGRSLARCRMIPTADEDADGCAPALIQNERMLGSAAVRRVDGGALVELLLSCLPARAGGSEAAGRQAGREAAWGAGFDI